MPHARNDWLGMLMNLRTPNPEKQDDYIKLNKGRCKTMWEFKGFLLSV